MAKTRDGRSKWERMRALAIARVVAWFALRRGRRDSGLIVLVGRAGVGNLAAFHRYLERARPDLQVAWFAPRRRDIGVGQHRGVTILSAHRPRDVWRVAHATAVYTTVGPGALRSWLRRPHRPLFLETWHGVGYKSRFAHASAALRSADAHLVSSPHVAEYYEKHGGRPIVTGYARMDDLLARTPDRAALERETGIPASAALVLVAPTWGCAPASGVDDREILVALSARVGDGLAVVYRPHKYASPARSDDLPGVFALGASDMTDPTDLLAMTDVLVTDWSSIAVDFLALGRPVIYRDAARPAASLAPLDETDRPGPVLRDARELADAVVLAIARPRAHHDRFGDALSRTRERAWGDTLDGDSARRYLDALESLRQTTPAADRI